MNKSNKKYKKNIDNNKKKKVAFSKTKRLKGIMLVFFLVLFAIIIRLVNLQIVQGSSLKEAMYNQLITSRVISPKRGAIYDANGKALARSAQVDTVTINPKKIVVENQVEEVAEIKTKLLKERVAKALSEIFEFDYKETLKKVSSSKSVETVAKKLKMKRLKN